MKKIVLALVLAVFAGSALALSVTLTATTEGGNTPTVVGKTNLPDGTELLIEISRKDIDYLAQTKTVVNNGAYRAGPFSKKGAGLQKGAYTIKVTMPVAPVQSPDVRKIIGDDGKNLSGPLVKKSDFGGKYVAHGYSLNINQ